MHEWTQTEVNRFYHSSEWKRVRLLVLQRDYYRCQVCKRAGRLTVADTVHHITPVKVDPLRRLDPDNLESICRACHNAEHKEKAKSQRAKKAIIKTARRRDTAIFKENPEIW